MLAEVSNEAWTIFGVVAVIALVIAFFAQIESDSGLRNKVIAWRGRMPSILQESPASDARRAWIAEGEKLAGECAAKAAGYRLSGGVVSQWDSDANNIHADIRAVIVAASAPPPIPPPAS